MKIELKLLYFANSRGICMVIELKSPGARRHRGGRGDVDPRGLLGARFYVNVTVGGLLAYILSEDHDKGPRPDDGPKLGHSSSPAKTLCWLLYVCKEVFAREIKPSRLILKDTGYKNLNPYKV
ncbi:jg10493 [Pararge aegeria aegeria]|uniref:Jg10493 protein n=1 Tax=Pararge aegeria aegeria TaxID=348720 RepID=A0A8S4RD63_9NEOP|nr:jg10493 [Pararge aegeria aegeria]